MATTAVLHSATRVIRRLTSDSVPVILPDESAQVVPDGFTLAGGPWKLAPDNVTRLAPTAAEQEAALTELVDSESVSLGGLVVLSNVGAAYDAITASRGLGMVELHLTGAAGLAVTVSVSKAGTGVQDWQLWNATDGVELGVVSDAGPVGDKTLRFLVLAPLPAGVKLLRLRVRSSVAADDPVYYGACVILRRRRALG